MTARFVPVARHDSAALRAIAAGLAGLSFAGAALGADDLSSAFGAASRWGCGGCADGGSCSWDDGFESLPLLPVIPTTSTPVMGGSCAAASPFASLAVSAPNGNTAGAVVDPIGGNATTKLVARYANAQAGFNAAVFRYSLMRPPGVRFIFRAQPGEPVRVRSEMYVTSIAPGWSVEPTIVSSGFILSRALWGGQNQTTGIGLPIGPVTDFYGLLIDPNEPLAAIFVPALFPAGHPSAGSKIPVPVNSWFTIEHEFRVGGEASVFIDLHDGFGLMEVLTGSTPFGSASLDRVTWRSNGGGAAGDSLYIDNLRIDGPVARCPGDANYDGLVTFADLNLVLSQFGQSGNLSGDVTGDGVVNFGDLNAVLSAFGAPCNPVD